ncbi:MAG TPA: cupredoxin domain-containing protein [Caulobacteraceae bacterium]|jgi:plastocyanin
MFRFSRGLVAALALGACLAGCAPSKPRAPQTFQIVVDKMAFGPAPVDLHVGDTVQWVNRDMFQHSATSKTGDFDVELPPGVTGSAVMKQGGTILYNCRYHPDMKGQLSVTP